MPARTPRHLRRSAENRRRLLETAFAGRTASVIVPHTVAPLNYSRRTLAHTDEYLAAAQHTDTRWIGTTVSFPGRDSLGRVNPRMDRRRFA